jgi:hypothetical protein
VALIAAFKNVETGSLLYSVECQAMLMVHSLVFPIPKGLAEGFF